MATLPRPGHCRPHPSFGERRPPQSHAQLCPHGPQGASENDSQASPIPVHPRLAAPSQVPALRARLKGRLINESGGKQRLLLLVKGHCHFVLGEGLSPPPQGQTMPRA